MKHEFRLVDVGEGLTEAEIVSWLVPVGDHVVEDQAVVEIETDKAVVEMPAAGHRHGGRTRRRRGSVIAVGELLLVVDDGRDEGGTEMATNRPPTVRGDRSSCEPRADAGAGARGRAVATVRSPHRPRGRSPAGSASTWRRFPAAVPAGGSSTPTSPPLPRRVGRRTVDARHGATASGAQVTAGSRIALRGVRKRTAETMTAAWQSVPHVDSFHEIDVTALFALREQFKPIAERRGVSVTLTAFFVRAAALALAEHPMLNSSIDVAAGEIVLHPERHIGVAVDTPDGLVLPVVRHADQRSVLDLAVELGRLGEAANPRRLSPAELAGGTFTVSNHGVFGGWFGTSLVHGSEVGIAGFGPARRRPEFDADDRIVARRILVMNLAADHRVVDGRDIINFGTSLRRLLEAPLGLLLDGG